MYLRCKFGAAGLAFFFTLLCSRPLNAQTTAASHNFETFSDHSGGKFNHLAVDHFSGWVYVGGVNRIYQLDSSLKLFSNITNGPVNDAPECSIFDCPPGISKKPTDNHNKALVVDNSTNRLIICGSTLQGMCTIHSRENISMVLQEVKEAVVANDANASTVAFIAHGPSQSPSSPSFVLYVGVTFTGNSIYRTEVPAIASRSLDPKRNLTIYYVDVTTSTQIFVDSLSRGSYIINYIFGFSSGSFSYFLTTQMNSSTSTSPYISKLVRVCNGDKDYYSYTEIPIECKVEGGRSYNLAQAAFVGKPGLELAQQLNNSVMDDVLFVIFSQSETNGGEPTKKPSNHCALCIYSLSVIEHQFKANIHDCFMGKGSFGVDHIIVSRKCIHTKINITEDFCGMDVNSPLDGKTPVTAAPVQTFNTQLTSVAATYTGDHTVVFVGTKNGHLKKLVVESSTEAIEYDDLAIDEGLAVNPDMIFDADMNYLYVMTERRVTKVKVQECNKYESCWHCLTANDPYCGWCSLENKCTLHSNCRDATPDVLSWIPYKTRNCTSIMSVTPKELQRTTAGTLELTIENSPPLTGQFLCDEKLTTNASSYPMYIFCPSINATTNGSMEIVVAGMEKGKGIRVKIDISGEFIVQTRFLCQFNFEGRLTNVNKNLTGYTIYCEEMQLQYTQEGSNMSRASAIIWAGSEPLHNPDDTHVVFYRCCDMADNSVMCLALDEIYNCGWCQSTERCEVVSQCDNKGGCWLDHDYTCHQSITSFSPQLGPWEGGTNITIVGIDLDQWYDNLHVGITVSGIPCELYRHLMYKSTRQIMCRVDGPGTSKSLKGPIVVEISRFRAESKDLYQFVDPKIESIFPRLGPRAGGTLLSVRGEYMNAGSNIEVFVDELPCHTVKIDQNEVQCITSLSNHQREGNIKVKFDQGVRLYDQDTYEYTADPTIEHLESGVNSLNKAPKGIPAGGIKISVTGKHLLSIQKPRFYVYDEGRTQRYFSKCEVHSDSGMTCPSPYMPDIDSSILDPEFPLQLHYGFEMDNVTSVQNISMKPGFPIFLLYPNPTFDTFPEGISNYTSDYLTITGQNIDSACQESDVVVQIGISFCNVTSLSKRQLICRPPETQPPSVTNGSNVEIIPSDPPDVLVSIGENFKVNIGKLRYFREQAYTGRLASAIYGGIVGFVVLILIFVAFFIVYRRKFTGSFALENMHRELHILELQEAVESFAKLQTRRTDRTSNQRHSQRVGRVKYTWPTLWPSQ